jgi:glycosyltransferase involved in cell wall biosynthesis
MLGSSWFERQMAKKAPLIFDFDDAIWLPNISSTNKLLSWLKGEDKVKDIIKAAAAVTVGNEFLADYARQFNSEVYVLPTTVDINRHRNLGENKSDRISIGWTGSHSTLPYFEAMLNLYKRLTEKYGEQIEFRLIGDPHLSMPSIDLKAQAWKMQTEVEDLNQFDIGIMPLPDSPWTQGKCGFKALQYMACEIPCVLSPVGVNTEIVEDGRNGLLASEEDEWFEKLCLLIESSDLRKQLGKAGRQTVVGRYSMQAHQQTWLEIFRRFAKSKN